MKELEDIKEQLVGRLKQKLAAAGPMNINLNEFGALADVIKDLSEAIYYCTVTEAMNDKSELRGYSQGGGRGNQGNQGSMGYSGGNQGTMGYLGEQGMMGHGDPLKAIRDMLATSDPATRAELYNQISTLFQ